MSLGEAGRDRSRPGGSTVTGLALDAAVALALSLAFAFWATSFMAVPTRAGTWLGVVDPPRGGRLALALAAASAAAWSLRRAPRELKKPLLAFGVAVLPLVSIATGRALPLLAFQGRTLLLLASAVFAVVAVRALTMCRLQAARVPTAVLVAVAFLGYVAFGTRVPGAARAQGDEPHYLLMAHSLVHDGDLDLANQYAERQYAPFYGGDLEPHVSAATPPGTAYLTHAPGLSILVAPAYAVGGYRGVVLLLSLLVAIGAALLRDVVRDACGDDRLALGVWAVVALTPPLPVHAVAIYPETVAVFAVAWLLWLRRGEPGLPAALLAGLVAGGLVWLHPKMLALGAAALLAVTTRLRGTARRLAALAAFSIAAATFLVYMRSTFGEATLAAGFGDPHLSLRNVPWGTLAQLFDRQRGLFAIAPVWTLAAFGAVRLLRARPFESAQLLLLAATPVLVGASYADWGGGACPPARFSLPAIAPLAVFLAPALGRRRDLAVALAGVGFGVLLVATGAPGVLRTPVEGVSDLLRNLVPIDLNGLFPNFQGGGPAPLLLAATALAGLALTWRFGIKGLLAASVAYAAVAHAHADLPLVDASLATRQALEMWDGQNARGRTAPLDVTMLELPLELAGGRHVIAAGHVRRSRGIDLPPGSYAVSFLVRPQGGAPAYAVASIRAGAVPLAEASLGGGPRSPEIPLLLPTGARGLGLVVAVDQGELLFERALVRCRALVPRSARGALTWSRRVPPEHYRLPRGLVNVTLLEGFALDGDAFQAVEAPARLAVDGPLTAAVALRVRCARPAEGCSIRWGRRPIHLAGAQEPLRLPMTEGERMGRDATVPLEVDAPGALVIIDALPRR